MMKALLIGSYDLMSKIGTPRGEGVIFFEMQDKGYLYAIVLPSGITRRYPPKYAADLKKFLNGRSPSPELLREFNRKNGEGYANKLKREFDQALKNAARPHGVLTAAQVKELLGVSEEVLKNWAKKNLVASATVNRMRVYKPEDIAKACKIITPKAK